MKFISTSEDTTLSIQVAAIDQPNRRYQLFVEAKHGIVAQLAWVSSDDFQEFILDIDACAQGKSEKAILYAIEPRNLELRVERKKWSRQFTCFYKIRYSDLSTPISRQYKLAVVAKNRYLLKDNSLDITINSANEEQSQLEILLNRMRIAHSLPSNSAIELHVNPNRLPIPHHLVELDKYGIWNQPKNSEKFKSLLRIPKVEAEFYSIDWIKSMTEADFWAPGTDSWFLGSADEFMSPGDIDRSQAVLIGDLGTGWDQPIALDYRVEDTLCPRVIFLSRIRDNNNATVNRWVTVANSVEEFTELIGQIP